MRPFRSVLYMPGSNARALDKARNLAADALILDLEDAVSPDQKINARMLIAGAINEGGYGNRYLIVRINGFDTEWGEDDLIEIAKCSPHAILMPKVSRSEDVQGLAQKMSQHANFEKTRIWAMMETPLGILNAAEIAQSSHTLEGLVLGTNDLVKDMHARHTLDRTPVLSALSQCILAARANNLVCVDGVSNDIRDLDNLGRECEQGRDLGFDGKTLIHPAQIEPANKAFGPTIDDLELAQAYVDAYAAALAQGKAVAVVGGKIVENLHVEDAKRLLAQAEAIKRMES